MERYVPGTGFVAAGSMLAERYVHTATLLQSGTVLLAGTFGWSQSTGRMAEIYDPSANQWAATGNMAQGRFAHTSTLLADGTVLLAAGGAFRGCGRTFCFYPTATSEIYDEATGKFTAFAHLNHARYYHTASLLSSGLVLIVGGIGGGALDSAEFYVQRFDSICGRRIPRDSGGAPRRPAAGRSACRRARCIGHRLRCRGRPSACRRSPADARAPRTREPGGR